MWGIAIRRKQLSGLTVPSKADIRGIYAIWVNVSQFFHLIQSWVSVGLTVGLDCSTRPYLTIGNKCNCDQHIQHNQHKQYCNTDEHYCYFYSCITNTSLTANAHQFNCISTDVWYIARHNTTNTLLPHNFHIKLRTQPFLLPIRYIMFQFN